MEIYSKIIVLVLIYFDIAGFFVKYKKQKATKQQILSFRVLSLVMKSPLYYFILTY